MEIQHPLLAWLLRAKDYMDQIQIIKEEYSDYLIKVNMLQSEK